MIEKTDLILSSILFVGIITAILLIGGFYKDSQLIEVSGSLECNSGDLNIYADFENIIQNKTCLYDKDLTCFNEDLLLKEMALEGIEEFNCKAEYSAKVPAGYFNKLLKELE